MELYMSVPVIPQVAQASEYEYLFYIVSVIHCQSKYND